jgi:hypothetical protein
MNVRMGVDKPTAFIEIPWHKIKCGRDRLIIPLVGKSGSLNGDWVPLEKQLQIEYGKAMGLPDVVAAMAAEVSYSAKCAN